MTATVTSPPRFRAGDTLPAVLVLRDLAELLGLGATRTWELYKAGEFARFELLPRLGNRPRFSGVRLQSSIDGTETELSEGSRYFAAARRQRMRSAR